MVTLKEVETVPHPTLPLNPSSLPRKKSGFNLSGLKKSLRKSSSFASFRLSLNSSGHLGYGIEGTSGHGLGLSGHGGVSSAAERHLRASCDDDPKSTTADMAMIVSDVNDNWELNSNVTSKSEKSTKSNTGTVVSDIASSDKRSNAYTKQRSETSPYGGYIGDVSSTLLDKKEFLPCENDDESSCEMFYVSIDSAEDSQSCASSGFPSPNNVFQEVFDFEPDKKLNSDSLIAKLSAKPSAEELGNVAAALISEVIQEASIVDRRNFAAIPRFNKTDVLIGKHLGKGTFSDVFEVIATLVDNQLTKSQLLGQAKNDLDQHIQAKFGEDNPKRFSGDLNYKHINKSSRLPIPIGSGDESFGVRHDLDKIIDDELEVPRSISAPPPNDVGSFMPAPVLSSSMCEDSLTHQRPNGRSRRVTLAMKCLRPAIRSNTEQFVIGVEDLVRETCMLSSLDHPHIIKIHGRAESSLSSSFRIGDGYFILLDRLQDTLDDRIKEWRKKYPKSMKSPPSVNQIKVATAIADAMSFLHEKKIIFRDLKPVNVGFDERGIVKLFDFGFAIGLNEAPNSSIVSGDDDLLYDRTGTPRYMAPEVGLDMGYGLPADVYSFGILLWEIFALRKPFADIKNASQFTTLVFQSGYRPRVGKNWPPEIKKLLEDSWTSYPHERPSMKVFKRTLQSLQRQRQISSSNQSDHTFSIFKRFSTGNLLEFI